MKFLVYSKDVYDQERNDYGLEVVRFGYWNLKKMIFSVAR